MKPLLEAQVKDRLAKAAEKLGKAEEEVRMWQQLLEIATRTQSKLTDS